MSDASAVIPRVPRFPDPEPPPDQLAQSAHGRSDEIARMAVVLIMHGVDLDRVAADPHPAIVALRSAGFAAAAVVMHLDRATEAARAYRDEIAAARRKNAAQGEYPC